MASPATHEVPWSTPFWTSFTLAINIIIQPSGDILSWRPRGKWQMYMRASPIMNVVDVADLWAALLYYSLTYLHQGIRDPVRMALYNVCESRGIKYNSGDDAPRMPVVRALLALLALSKCLKLLFCTGIPWTLTVAYCYIFTFATFEILAITASLALRDTKWREKAAMFVQTIEKADDVPWAFVQRPLLVMAWLGQFICSLNVLVPLLEHVLAPWKTYKEQHPDEWLPMITGFLRVTALMCSFPLFILIVYSGSLYVAKDSRFFYKHVLLLDICGDWEDDRSMYFRIDENKIGGAAFALTTTVFVTLHALLFYLWGFDGTDTYKPAWTENLL